MVFCFVCVCVCERVAFLSFLTFFFFALSFLFYSPRVEKLRKPRRNCSARLTGFHRVLPSFSSFFLRFLTAITMFSFCRVSQFITELRLSSPRFYWVSPGYNHRLYRVLRGSTVIRRTLPGFLQLITKFDGTFHGFIEVFFFHRFWPRFTALYQVFMARSWIWIGFPRFYWVSIGFSQVFIGIYWFFCRVSRWFTLCWLVFFFTFFSAHDWFRTNCFHVFTEFPLTELMTR